MADIRRMHFERLDQTYLDDLVVRAGRGDSNAFAELFASVSGRQLYYLTYLFGDRAEAKQALAEVATLALRGIASLTKPRLFMAWISRLSANVFLGHRDDRHQDPDGSGEHSLSQILNLPLMESQVMLMCMMQGLTEAETGDILNLGRSSIRRFIKAGLRHAGSSGRNVRIRRSGHSNTHYEELSPTDAVDMLDRVFEECGRKANTVPMEALSSYAVYRKERFSLQRGILALALIMFMLIPGLFLIPHYNVEALDEGERGLPVYTIDISSVLPARRVLASIKGHNLPVYEADSKEYTVEPTRNGSLRIEVELINRQRVTNDYDVTAVDAESPQLTGNETTDDYLILHAADEGIGVDYREVYAVGESGEVYHPVSADEDGIVFDYPEEKWDIYIPDHIGNTLHLAVSLK